VSLYRGHVLIVEDNPTYQKILVNKLQKLNFIPEVAGDGEEALKILKKEAFDLILLDVMMPKLNGVETLKTIKQDPILRHIPVIMISALEEVESTVECIELGAEDYLHKPFNPTFLEARVNASIERKLMHDKEESHRREIEREKKRSEEILKAIFPLPIYEQLKNNQEIAPCKYDDVAVLFADVVSFSRFCEIHNPVEIVNDLKEWVAKLEQIAIDHNCMPVKTIGDAMMVTAGLMDDQDNPEKRLVECALAMKEASPQLKSKWKLRIGIHSGPVVAGVIGNKGYSFDIWGDTVNTSFRIQGAGQNDAVNVSREVWNKIEPYFVGVPMGTVFLKTKGDTPLYEVLESKK
jgi:adenylate cyclase